MLLIKSTLTYFAKASIIFRQLITVLYDISLCHLFYLINTFFIILRGNIKGFGKQIVYKNV